jgi:hypothetical protein
MVKQYKFSGAATHHNCEGARRSDRARADDPDFHDIFILATKHSTRRAAKYAVKREATDGSSGCRSLRTD